MKQKLLLFLTILFVTSLPVFSQDKSNAKFGKVSADDFKPTVYSVDSSASAVVIADIGSTEIVGNSKGGFSLLYKHYRRVHILNKNGYDIGDVAIRLYTNGDMEEQLDNLKAVTYNLENGKVVETKLDTKSGVFKDKINKRIVVKKFTFPNIKEGSIIEYEYKIHSDFIFNLQPWDFQGAYPRLWSEYNVAMPEFYNYVTLTQGYQSYHIRNTKTRTDNFTMSDTRGAGASDRSTFGANVADHRWVMKDVPALKEESYTSTLSNHIARIEFQLSSIGHPFTYRNVMSSWGDVAKQMLEDEDFGAQLKKDNGWLNDVMDDAVKNAKDPMDKAKNIYAWVRDHFTCTNKNRIYLEQPLRVVLKNRNGSEADINLLLATMLRKADIQADPVLLSTRSNGYTHSVYPLMDRFNYVICRMEIDGKEYFLDASEPRMGFAKLGYQCFNGHARIINSQATALDLNPETLKESKFTSVFIINNEKGESIGSMQQTPGYYESWRLRDILKEGGEEKIFKDLKKSFGADIEITSKKIDSVNKLEDPLTVSFEFDMKKEDADILYLNPMFGEGFKENPFKSAQRFYPVEMPYTIDAIYNLQFEIPKGYVVDELPKQSVVKFNEEGDASFEYRISESNGTISLRSRVYMKRTFFAPEEYEILREFFNLIVKKHNEQIVFKKKS